MIAKRTVTKKVKQLSDLGLIQVKLNKDNWPEYRIKGEEIYKAARLAINKIQLQESDPTVKPIVGEATINGNAFSDQNHWYAPAETTGYTPGAHTLYAEMSYSDYTTASCSLYDSSDDIDNIYKIKKEASVTNTVVDTYEVENSSLPLKGKESVSIADQVDKAVDMEKEEEEQHNTNISQTARPLIEKTEKIQNSEVSTETEVVQNEEKENNMNEDVRVVLKSYDKIPKNKRGPRDRGSISALYRQYGDSIEKLINEHGLEQVLDVMEIFKNDQYCVDKLFPLSLFIFRVKNYSKNASPDSGGYHGVGKQEKIAPRAVSAQAKPMPVIPVDGDPHAEYRQIIRDRHHRVRDVTFMVKVVEPGKLKEFENLTGDVSKVDPAVVEGWFTEYFRRWKETHGGFEPTCRSKPIC